MNKYVLLLALLAACNCESTVNFDYGVAEECESAEIYDWEECTEYLLGLENTCEPVCEEWQECGDNGCGGDCGRCPEAAPWCVEDLCSVDPEDPGAEE